MTDTLAREVAAYAFCMLDDTWVEAGHRDVSKLQESRPKAKLHYLAASLRLDQNLEFWDDTEGDNREFLVRCYRQYRAMGHLQGQRQPRRRRRQHRMTPKQTASRRFILNTVYRLKQASRTAWSARLRDILSPMLPLAAAPDIQMQTKLKLEYLQLALKDRGHLFSFPQVNEETAARARDANSVVNALAILDTAPERSYTFFEVVDFGAGRKKVARTSQQLRAARMCQPVSVQFWQRRPADGGEDTYVVQPVGPPEVVDLMFLAEWQILRAGLRKWTRTSTGQPGCLTLTQPLAVCQTAWNWRNGDEVPQVAILDYLATQGWRHGPIVSHTLFTPKHLRPPTGKGGTAKAYFQCLACLPDLLKATFPALPAGQPID